MKKLENYTNDYKEKLRIPDEAVKSAPWAMGGERETIHISEVYYIVNNSSPLPTIPTDIANLISWNLTYATYSVDI
jgi:hypothetical protein